MQQNGTQRRALVTGGSRGLGRAIAIALANEGCDIGIIYRTREDEAHAVVDEIAALGRRAVAARADVGQWDQVEAAVAQLTDQLGGLDIVVANAGIASPNQTVWEMPIEKWHKIVNVNLNGAYYTTKATVPHLLSSGPGASFVFVSTVGSLKGAPTQGPYVAAKAAVNSLTRSLALELAPHGVRVNAVAPGIFATDMTDLLLTAHGEDGIASMVPSGRAGQPEELGQTVVWLCSNAASYVTGEVIRVDGGLAT
ncbi:MAG: SDR family NAD(P)-dependent oxidoreductase [Actinomycetota bacterium]